MRLVGSIGVALLIVLATVDLQWFEKPPNVQPVPTVRADSELTVEVANESFDLPPKIHIAGYPGWKNREASGGIQGSVGARTLRFNSAGKRVVAIVLLDLLLIAPGLEREIQERAGNRNVLVVATHTHSGPGGYFQALPFEVGALGRFNPTVRSAIVSASERTLVAPSQDSSPCVLEATQVPTATFNTGRTPGRDPDQTVTVLNLSEDFDGFDALILAAHPTTAGREPRLSRDVPDHFDHGFVFQGAGGDAAPGQLLRDGDALDAWLAPVQQLRCTPVSLARVEIALPPLRMRAGPWPLQRLLTNLLLPWRSRTTVVSVLRLGDVVLGFVPGEPVGAFGEPWRNMLRDLTGAKIAAVVSLASDYIGYVETPEMWERGEGEAKRVYYGPQLGTVIADGLATAARAVAIAQ